MLLIVGLIVLCVVLLLLVLFSKRIPHWMSTRGTSKGDC